MVAMEKVYHHHQQVILDRWNPLGLNKKIATHFGLTIKSVIDTPSITPLSSLTVS